MTAEIKLLQNNENEAHIKIKNESGDDTTTLKLSKLVYKPKTDDFSFDIDDRPQSKFQDVTDHVNVSIRAAQWSGTSQDGNCVIKRGGKFVMGFCVGDTCQYEFMGQDMVADQEHANEDITFELHGNITIWMKLRKHGYINHVETGTYGVYDNETKVGSK